MSHNIYQAPDADLSPETPDNDSYPEAKFYKIAGIGIAAFVSGAFAGSYLMYRNFKNMGKTYEARKALVFGFVIGSLSIAISNFAIDIIPLNDLHLGLIEFVIMLSIAKVMQGDTIAFHRFENREVYSNWRAFGIAILFNFGLILFFFLLLFIIQPEALQAWGWD